MKRYLNVRFLCAALGVAAAVGTVVFMSSLKTTNDAQGVRLAERMLAAVPVEQGAETLTIAVDYRPDGRVLQGPPMMMTIATRPSETSLVRGEILVARSFFERRKAKNPPQYGDELKLVGRKGAYTVKIRGFLENVKSVRGYPCAFVSPETAADIAEEWRPYKAPTAAELAPSFMTDGGKNFNRASTLLLWAAALTALCLLVNSLFLSVEANRRETAILRMVGMTRGTIVLRTLVDSFAATGVGYLVGVLGAVAALVAYVRADVETFPAGPSLAVKPIAFAFAVALAVAVIATLVALRSALAVRPLEAASVRPPKKNRLGMAIAFTCGFGAFVAVEVWGCSLMGSFIPSKEWPDAIVSILPGGVSPWEIEKLGALDGVMRISELAPLQVPFEPLEEMKKVGDSETRRGRRVHDGVEDEKKAGDSETRRGRRVHDGVQYKNVLFLASDRLPRFRMVAGGDFETVERAVMEGRGCVITEMMARARGLKLGDLLRVNVRGEAVELPVAGIADLNWHMVTSRGLVRGMNRMPVMTSGPAFISFDTLDSFDARPAQVTRMTHLWLDYEPEFLSKHGVFPAGRLVEREIAAALGDPEEVTVRLHARDEVADGTLAHGDDIIGSMARVPYIFLAVLALGFIAMLVAVVEACKREYVLLRTVGATRLQLTARLAGEALRTSLIGIVFGTAGGALVGWLFTAGTRAAMSDWGLPPRFVFPTVTILEGAFGAILIVLAVAVPVSLHLIGRLTRR